MYTKDNVLDLKYIVKNLSTCFKDIDDAKNYLKTVNYENQETVELSFQYNLPKIYKLDKQSLEFWHGLNSYVPKIGREPLQLFSDAHLLSDNKQFKQILNDKNTQELLSKEIQKRFFEGKFKKEEKNIKEKITTLTKKLNKELIEKKYKYKEEKLEDSIKKYHFSKLPKEDMQGFVLGKLSNCCQSIGDHSEKCVLDGMSKTNAGFYIITNDQNKIKAQSYAWLAKENEQQN